MSSRRPVIAAGALIVAAAVAFGGGVALADDGDGVGIGVTVIDDTPSPTPTPTPSRSPSPSSSSNPGGGGGGGGNGGGGGGSTPSPTGSGTPTPGPDGGDGTDGWIVVSGLDPSARAELNPFGGWVHVLVSVANRSESTSVSGKLVFRMFTVFGTQLGPSITQPVYRIGAGDVWDASATLPGVSQWTFVRVTAEFIPRGATEESGSIVRESWVFAFPWLLLALIVAVAAWIAIRWVRRRSAS